MAGIALAAVLFLGCQEAQEVEIVAARPGPDQACAVDGMLLAVHDGPKAQLLRADGDRAFFCDTKSIFDEWLNPVRRRRVVGIWFQTLDEAPWQAHAGGWAAADSLYFVVGSRRMGSMGPTLAPFEHRDGARRFAAEYGGEILRFDAIDAEWMAQLQQQAMAQFD